MAPLGFEWTSFAALIVIGLTIAASVAWGVFFGPREEEGDRDA